MSTFFAKYPVSGGGGGVPIYATFASFPAGNTQGDLAVAADTGYLYEWNGSAWQLIASPGGALTLANLDAQSPTAKGAALIAGALSMQSADATHPGLVNNTTQSFSGNKTFTGTIAASNLSGTNTGDVTLGTANGLTLVGQALSLTLSSTSTTGALSSTDWNTFNGKQAAGNYITALTGDITAAGPGSAAATVAKIQGTTVSGTTGSTNVVFSSAPTLSNPIVGTQAASDSSTKAASTAYVTAAINAAIAGVNPAVAVQAATTAASDTSSYTYNNGVSGVGATLTGPTNTALTVDGYTFTALNQRLLVKNDTQSPSGAFNGVYFVTQLQALGLGVVLTRALDYNTPSDMNNTGAIPVINGTVNGTTSWVLTSQVTTVGTDPLTFTEFTRNPADYLLKANNLSDVANTTTAFNNISPMTTLGDTIYGGASGTRTRLAGNTTATKQYLTQTGDGVNSAAPVWNTIASADLPTITLTSDVTGAASGGSIATTIGANKVLNTMIRQSAGLSVIGRGASTTGNVADITGVANQVLVVNSGATALAFSALNLASSAAVTGILPVANGGTGLAALTAHDVIIGNGTSAATLVAPSATTGVALISNGTSADPSFGAINLASGTAVTGALAIANGGTNNAALAVTAGGVLYTDGSKVVNVGAGTSGQVLQSAAASPPVWATNSLAYAITSQSTTYAAAIGDYILANSGSAFTITLPTAAGNSGKSIVIKKTSNDFNVITVSTTSSQTIDGVVGTTVNTQYECLTVTSDGSNWSVTDRKIPGIWITYTPTLTGFGSTSALSCWWRRVGADIFLRCKFTTGTPTGVEARMSLPGTLTSDGTVVASIQLAGEMVKSGSGAVNYVMLIESSVTYATFGLQYASAGGLTKAVGTTISATGETLSIFAEIPISGWNG